MYSQKSYTQKLGSCSETIKSSGCLITSFSNWLEVVLFKQVSPPEINEICRKLGFYTNGCMLNLGALASHFGLTYKKTFTDPKQICIAETDHYAKVGYPQHFFLYRDGKRVDPLDSVPDWEDNNYHIVSYRVLAPSVNPKIEPTAPITPEPIQTPPETPEPQILAKQDYLEPQVQAKQAAVDLKSLLIKIFQWIWTKLFKS